MLGNSIYHIKVATDLSTEPVAGSEFKTFANIAYSDSDALIDLIIKTARIQLEDFTGKSFGIKTIECFFSTTGNGINLPKGPINQITALEYRPCPCSGVVTFTDVVANTDDWQLINSRFYYNTEGEFKATYTTSGIINEAIKSAVKAQALFLYENRGDVTKQAVISPIAKGLVSSIMNIA